MVSLASVHTDCGHEVELAGAWPVRSDGVPTIIERRDEDFIAALLAEMAGETPEAIATDQRPGSATDGKLRLFQPIHRVFNLALLEAHCTNFGTPRLDGRQIASAGLVVRRVRTTPAGAKDYDAWCATKSKVTGWLTLPDSASPDHLRDPDPARRPQPRITGDFVFDRAQFGSTDFTAEETTSLFVAPPAIAQATTRTLLYGTIPVTSSSRAGGRPKGPALSDTTWISHLSYFLKTQGSPTSLWPTATSADKAATLAVNDLKDFPITLPEDAATGGRARFILLVSQLTQEFSLLRPVNAATTQRLIDTLNTLTLTLVNGTSVGAGKYISDAANFYFGLRSDADAQPTPLSRPQTWPVISAATAQNLQNILREISGELELSLFAGDKAGGRFDDFSAVYVVRAFIRVKQSGDCPPKIVWSPYSDEFRIVPWYETGPVAPALITLPDPFAPGFLKNVKPNVAFSVPASLANFLNQDPLALMKGDGKKKSGGLTLDWICGFSIPIITICAFILLSIILGILNLIFFWLPFVKICIPFPRPASPPPSSTP
jgi:hypothetical protein